MVKFLQLFGGSCIGQLKHATYQFIITLSPAISPGCYSPGYNCSSLYKFQLFLWAQLKFHPGSLPKVHEPLLSSLPSACILVLHLCLVSRLVFPRRLWHVSWLRHVLFSQHLAQGYVLNMLSLAIYLLSILMEKNSWTQDKPVNEQIIIIKIRECDSQHSDPFGKLVISVTLDAIILVLASLFFREVCLFVK